MAASTEKYILSLDDVKFVQGLNRAVNANRKLRASMGKTTKSVGKAGGGGIAGALGGLGRLAAPLIGLFAVKKVFDFGAASVSTAMDMQVLSDAIKFASGSAEEGNRNLDFIKQTTNELGTPLQSALEGFKTLSGAMMGTSLQGAGTRDIFESVSQASAVMGLDAEQSKGAFLALGQMMSKGKVQAEELRGQLGERLPGAFKIAAKAMGVTQQELNKMMEDGKLMSEDFLPKFSKALREEFAGGVEKAAMSARANMNRFNNTMLSVKTSIGTALLPMISKLTKGFESLVNFVKNNLQNLKDVFAPITDFFVGISDLFAKVREDLFGAAEGTDMLQSAMNVLGNVLQFLKPIFEAAISLLGSVWESIMKIVNAFDNLTTDFPVIGKAFRGLLGGMKSSLISFAQTIGDIFGGIANIIGGVFNRDFDQIKTGVKGLASAISISGAAKSLVGGVISGYNSDGTQTDFFKNQNKQEEAQRLGTGFTGATGTGKTGGVTGASGKIKSGLSEVTAGAPKTFNINIEKLVESLNLTTQNLTESAQKVKEEMTKALLTAVNDTQIISTGR